MNAKISIFLVFLSVLTACARTDSAPEGEPERSVFVVMSDDFSFEPSEIEVAPGETVEFQVANKGLMVHEFLIGDAERQDEYEREAVSGGHEAHGGGVPGVSVNSGEEKSFVYVFPKEPKPLLFGCHEPGHYPAGMKGNFRFGSS